SVNDSRPSSSAWKTMYMVITLLIEAVGIGSSAFFSNSTVPVVASTTMASRARVSMVWAAAGPAAPSSARRVNAGSSPRSRANGMPRGSVSKGVGAASLDQHRRHGHGIARLRGMASAGAVEDDLRRHAGLPDLGQDAVGLDPRGERPEPDPVELGAADQRRGDLGRRDRRQAAADMVGVAVLRISAGLDVDGLGQHR